MNGEVDPGDPATVMLAFPGEGAFCSGTVVSPHIVLTAAHCLFAPTDSEVWFGPNDRSPTERIPITHGDVHPQFDIGMVTMGAPAPVTAIPMLETDLSLHIDQPVRIVGYGVTSEDGSDSGTKRQGLTKLHHVEGEVMYTGYEGSSTCYGDSGGPNFMTLDGTEYVVGVTSFGTTVCGQPEDGAIRTDSSIDWLQAYVAEHDDAIPPTVSITSPGDEASVLPGFTVTADASDDRSVAKVELLVDGTVNDVDETRPYEMQGQPGVTLGMHQVEVRAVDGAGNRTGATITVVVAPACGAPGECEDGLSCVDGACLGDLGGTCDLHGQCASGLCGVVDGVNLCTQRCGEGSEGGECPSGFHCEEPMLAGGSGQCAPGGSGGGCAAGGGSGGQGGGWLLGFALLLLARRRR